MEAAGEFLVWLGFAYLVRYIILTVDEEKAKAKAKGNDND